MNKFLATLLLAAIAVSVRPAFAQEPFEQVEQAIAELSEGVAGREEELRNDEEALYELINSVLLPRFDRRYAAQLVLGKHWREADESQREQFVEGFYDSLLRKYADGVLEFNPDRIQLLPFRGDLSKKRTIVKTTVSLNDGTRVTVNYGFVMRSESWKMFDVTIEGISYIRNFRAEMDSEIRATGLDAVIARLENDGQMSGTSLGDTASE